MITEAPFGSFAHLRLLALALLLLVAPAALAQSSITVRIMTDSLAPTDFGANYPLGQLSNTAYAYGTSFIIEVSYDIAVMNSLNLSLSGVQADYQLVWRVVGATDNNPFGSSLGADVTGLSGSASGQYYRNDGTLQTLPINATSYRIGAKSTTDASEDLSVQVTLTATLY